MELQEDFTTRKIFFTKNQAMAALMDTNIFYGVYPRGDGKTSRILTRRYQSNMRQLPGSSGFLVGPSYKALLTRILPSFVNGLSALGWVRGQHYEIGKPLKGAPMPLEPPLNFEHFFHCYNGSGFHLISQDKMGSSNGLNTHWGGGDEAKLLDYDKMVEETFPTMRADKDKFNHHHLYRSIMFLTDMPTNADAQWILKKELEVEAGVIEKIEQLASKIQELIIERLKYKETSSNFSKLSAEINSLNKIANWYRLGGNREDINFNPTTYYAEPRNLANVQNLGTDFVLQQQKLLPDFVFRTSILNMRPTKVEEGFYPKLSIERHTYLPTYDNNLLESCGYDLSQADKLGSLVDTDVIKDKPLIITIDWGVSISTLTVGQNLPNDYRIVRDFYVKHPQLIKELAEQFHNHYSAHYNKQITYFWYSGENPRTMQSNSVYAVDFGDELTKLGWNVHLVNLVTPADPQQRFHEWYKIFSPQYSGKPFRLNRVHAKNSINSMLLAPAKQAARTGKIQKDKKSEGNKSIDQVEATHFSDAIDTHMHAVYLSDHTYTDDYLPIIRA